MFAWVIVLGAFAFLLWLAFRRRSGWPGKGAEGKMNLYYGQCVELIRSLEKKNIIGKLTAKRQDIRDAYVRKIEDLLLKMIDIDKDSSRVEEIRQKLYEFR